MANDLHVEIIDAIIAGIGSDDNPADQAMAIIENLERAGYVIAAQQDGVRSALAKRHWITTVGNKSTVHFTSDDDAAAFHDVVMQDRRPELEQKDAS